MSATASRFRIAQPHSDVTTPTATSHGRHGHHHRSRRTSCETGEIETIGTDCGDVINVVDGGRSMVTTVTGVGGHRNDNKAEYYCQGHKTAALNQGSIEPRIRAHTDHPTTSVVTKHRSAPSSKNTAEVRQQQVLAAGACTRRHTDVNGFDASDAATAAITTNNISAIDDSDVSSSDSDPVECWIVNIGASGSKTTT